VVLCTRVSSRDLNSVHPTVECREPAIGMGRWMGGGGVAYICTKYI